MATVFATQIYSYTTVHHPVKSAFYRPELDVLRFFAFLLVFVHHTVPRHGVVANLSPAMSTVITSISKTCGFGLCLFFTLSAYLITELLVRERHATGDLNIKAFYIRRALRIWPLYALGLAIGIALVLYRPITGGLERYAAYALLAGNWYCAAHLANIGKSPMEILWSISIEEQFYIFWPVLATAKAKELLRVAAITLLLISAAALVVLAKIGAPNDAVWFNSFVQFGMFGAGALLSIHLYGYLPRWRSAMRISMGIGGVALWFIASSIFHLKDSGSATAVELVAGYLSVELACVMILLSVLGIAPRRIPRVFVFLGRISFGLYVFHELALAIASHLLHKLDVGYAGLARIALGLLITILFSTLSYHFYEKPFLKLKKRMEIVKSRPV